jgi:hypothetical protein
MARAVLKQFYAAERLQPSTSLGIVLGTYGMLWARTRALSDVGERFCGAGSAPVLVCGSRGVQHFQGTFYFSLVPAFSLFLSAWWSD